MSTQTLWLEAQNGVIGSVLIKPRLAPAMLAECSAEDFSDQAQTAYLAIQNLVSEGRAVDAMTINSETNGSIHDWLYQILEITPTAENFRSYCEATRSKATMHRVQMAMLEAANAGTLKQMEAALDDANAALITERKAESFSISDLVMDFYDRKQREEHYLTTGMGVLDRMIYLNKGDFGLIGGYPSRGKTSLALQLAAEQAKTYRVGFYSLETNASKIMDRIIAQQSGVPMDRVKKGNLDQKDWDRIGEASAQISGLQLDIIEAAGMTVDDIFRTAISKRHEIIYIDYLQIVRAGNTGSRYEAVTDISIRLHTLAQRNKIAVVALSQLSRNADSATEEPNLSSLRESGQLEQDADFIMFCYCEKKNELDGNRILKIAKNKEGQTGKVQMFWNAENQLMFPISKRNEQENGIAAVPAESTVSWNKKDIRSVKNKFIGSDKHTDQNAEQIGV